MAYTSRHVACLQIIPACVPRWIIHSSPQLPFEPRPHDSDTTYALLSRTVERVERCLVPSPSLSLRLSLSRRHGLGARSTVVSYPVYQQHYMFGSRCHLHQPTIPSLAYSPTIVYCPNLERRRSQTVTMHRGPEENFQLSMAAKSLAMITTKPTSTSLHLRHI
jgi:hypothetical protein